jgi:drug/metabolite transporter (DMT)-like permease
MNPKFIALLAAVLFGASAPFAKILLGNIAPIPLAGLLYLGSGLSLLIFKIVKKDKHRDTKINKADIKWLLGAIIAGGILAPIVLLFSLQTTPASTASLLLNFETVATTLIAALFFREAIGKKIWLSILFITIAGIVLTLNLDSQWGFSIGAIGIIFACILWGIDNNLTRNISAKDPSMIVIVKGLAGGTFSIFLAYLLKEPLPSLTVSLYALLLGAFSYGLSLLFFISALRDLGAARTSALFGTAPFIGAILSFLIFKNTPGTLLFLSLPFMIIGTYLILKEKHEHTHFHEAISHEHTHRHNDIHHNHVHENMPKILEHSHEHTHEAMEHEHSHTPDIHHRHSHKV